MKGHDNMPARVMEERVRDAFSPLRPTAPGLPGDGGAQPPVLDGAQTSAAW
jgi:hypothetical protein